VFFLSSLVVIFLNQKWIFYSRTENPQKQKEI